MNMKSTKKKKNDKHRAEGQERNLGGWCNNGIIEKE